MNFNTALLSLLGTETPKKDLFSKKLQGFGESCKKKTGSINFELNFSDFDETSKETFFQDLFTSYIEKKNFF